MNSTELPLEIPGDYSDPDPPTAAPSEVAHGELSFGSVLGGPDECPTTGLGSDDLELLGDAVLHEHGIDAVADNYRDTLLDSEQAYSNAVLSDN